MLDHELLIFIDFKNDIEFLMEPYFRYDHHDKNRSLFSVIVQMFANPKIGFYVSRNSFYPVPDVDSAFISLYFNNKKRDDKIVNMVKLMFANKRKQVINNLSCLASKKDLESIFRSLKLNPKLRAEDLSINDIEMLGEILKDKIK